MMIWTAWFTSPTEFLSKMKDDKEFREAVLAFLTDLIKQHTAFATPPQDTSVKKNLSDETATTTDLPKNGNQPKSVPSPSTSCGTSPVSITPITKQVHTITNEMLREALNST